MRLTVITTGLLMCAVSFAASPQPVSALSIEALLTNKPSAEVNKSVASEEKKPAVEVTLATKVEPKPIEHLVAAGENLESIATANKTTWSRLYDKNTGILDPNLIEVGQIVIIPLSDEQLVPRAVVETAAQPAAATRATVRQAAATKAAPVSRGSSVGNSYSYGYCTYYAKNRRPDLPNNLGNAISWVARAAAQGYATGSTPRPGAIGQQGNHVVYVEAVNADGTIVVSEMNYQGFGIVSSRVASAGSFRYVY